MATEAHYVLAARVATIGLFLASSATVYLLDTAKDAFDVILQVGAGTGLLYLVRWFWWRVTAWCEVVAMISSFGVSLVLLALNRRGVVISTHAALIVTIAATTVSWVLTAFLGPQTDREVLVAFYRKVRPAGPGWEPIRAVAGLPPDDARTAADDIPMAMLGWAAGCTVIWSALFTVGSVLYGRMGQAAFLAAVFIVSGLVLLRVVRRLWSSGNADESRT